MKVSIKIVLTSIIVALVAFVSGSGNVMAQQYGQTLKQQLVGTWTLVSSPQNGPNPLGIAVYDSAGHFVVINMRSDLPKFASSNRSTGTPDENKAIVEGSIAFFGTYTVADDHTLIQHVQGSTFPNFNGTDQKRSASITGDELRITIPALSVGGSGLSVYRRAK